MKFETHAQYLFEMTKRAKKFTMEDLYNAVKIYLEAKIKYPGNPKLESGLSYELFKIHEEEILEREGETNYLQDFGDLLVRAGIITKHPYEITDRRMIN